MASVLGLDLSRNLSYYTVRAQHRCYQPITPSGIPAAFVCAVAPHFYAVFNTGKAYDNANPATFKDRIAQEPTLSEAAKGRFIRAKSASQNGFETLGLFAAAVASANQAGIKPRTLNIATWGYVGARVAYNLVYVLLGGIPNMHVLRSQMWNVSMLICLGLFIGAGRKL
ncbi:hypothetical protein ACO1O0_003794 [Amphichorda felina]